MIIIFPKLSKIVTINVLMHGFDKKVFQLKHEENNEITFKIEVDFVGDGKWSKYSEI